MDSQLELLQGTLDLLILQTLAFGPAHGHAIARIIQQRSEEVLQVGHGSLYPALQRMLKRGLIVAEDGTFGKQSQGQVLPADGEGQKEAHSGDVEMAALRERDCAAAGSRAGAESLVSKIPEGRIAP